MVATTSTDVTMSVNVRLCGSIPRRDMKLFGDGAPVSRLASLTSSCNRLNIGSLAATNGCKNEDSTLSTTSTFNGSDHTSLSPLNEHPNMRGILTEHQALTPLFEPPSWAVPAKGEAHLEPVCEALGRQTAVDLTTQNAYRVGRSPNCDVQLMHGTSSRRHAMLFHHSNGSCYVVDCGSAHGTFINGRRISSPGCGGMVVPHKVRRGAIIRFGGPGAPCFVLKSFSFCLSDVAEGTTSTPDMGELVRRNTRFNALGKAAAESVKTADVFRTSTFLYRKRSFDSLASSATLDEEEPSVKRLRCTSPPPSPDSPLLRLISPDMPSMLVSKPRRVHFSTAKPLVFFPALVTPGEVSSEEEDNDDC
ncbi:predicted protein [Phaeodactylum tricornutum CCAP 1055/1]|jgi:hypothetical protein|uniref:FHA domain-containing protein n=2 Tax=Phaeodactylum tricornutum TaxID=2850 RepID=B7G556_PHATC|nr:predicted protein [Phaeodactylum tricornutum CCAP 1055/1]EEC46089.1 predicted protein [Phaeodactylum tricornutum CCAP 1055/1]|eukprot:XP_002182188.1 predicted protein [Phaeodactylum tricornutum CCAP 1055/1]